MCEIPPVDADQGRENRVAALGDVFHADLVGEAPVLRKVDVAGQLAIVAEKSAAALAEAFSNLGVASAAQTVDKIGHNLLAFGGARFRHHRIGPLRADTRSECETGNENSNGDVDSFQPHKTEPP